MRSWRSTSTRFSPWKISQNPGPPPSAAAARSLPAPTLKPSTTVAWIACSGPVRNDQRDRVGAVARRVRRQPVRRVALRIDGDRHEMEVGAEVARALADLGHPLAEQRAGRLARGEHEIGDPDLARQLAAAERLAALVGERERGQAAEHRRATRSAAASSSGRSGRRTARRSAAAQTNGCETRRAVKGGRRPAGVRDVALALGRSSLRDHRSLCRYSVGRFAGGIAADLRGRAGGLAWSGGRSPTPPASRPPVAAASSSGPSSCGSPGERLDLSIQRLNADGLVVLARLPDVHHAVAIPGRQQGVARPERDRGRPWLGGPTSRTGSGGIGASPAKLQTITSGPSVVASSCAVAAPAQRPRLERACRAAPCPCRAGSARSARCCPGSPTR